MLPVPLLTAGIAGGGSVPVTAHLPPLYAVGRRTESCPGRRGWPQPGWIPLPWATRSQPGHCGQHWNEAVGPLSQLPVCVGAAGGNVARRGMGRTDLLLPDLCPKPSRALPNSAWGPNCPPGRWFEPGPLDSGPPKVHSCYELGPHLSPSPSTTCTHPPHSWGLPGNPTGGPATENWGILAWAAPQGSGRSRSLHLKGPRWAWLQWAAFL